MRLRDQRLETSGAPSEQGLGPSDGTHRRVESPYLTSTAAVAYLQLGSLGALYWHIRENRLPVGRIGGRYRFDKRELDRWVAGQSLTVVRKAR